MTARTWVLPGALFAGVACSTGDRDQGADARTVLPAGGPRAAATLDLGAAFYREDRFDSAHAVWARGLANARQDRDSVAQARFLTELGFVSRRLGRPADARAYQDTAILLKTRLNMRDELARSLNALGLVALTENRNGEAARLFERSLRAAASVGDAAGVAKASSNAGLAYAYLGDLARARAGHRALNRVGADMANDYYRAQAMANEATVDIAEGDLEAAMQRLDSARRFYATAATGRGPGEQNLFIHYASAAELRGEFGRALALLDSALVRARNLSLVEKQVEALRMLAGVHRRIGDHRLALRYLEQGEAQARSSGVHADLGTILADAAQSHAAVGNLARALDVAAEAYRLHREGGEVEYLVDDLLLLADLHARNGGAAEGRRFLAAADSTASRLGNPFVEARVAVARARAADRARDPRGVLRALGAIDSAARTFDHDIAWTSAALAARAYARLALLDSAIAAGGRAVDAIERVRGRLVLEPMRLSLASERSEVYADHVLTLLRAGRAREAFVVADRARSRGLLEQLASVQRGPRGRRSAAGDLSEGEALLRRIDALLQALRRGTPPDGQRRTPLSVAADEQFDALMAARSEFEALVARATHGKPRTSALLGVVSSSVPQVQDAVEPGEAVVEYHLAADTLIAFVITRDAFTARRWSVDAGTLVHRVRLLRDLWSSPRVDWTAGLPTATALYDDLLRPIGPELVSARRLVIVPHGVLAQVPFAALRTGARYLVEEKELVHAPSATAFAAVRAAQRGQDRRTPEGHAFAPFEKSLPASRAEVIAVAAVTAGKDYRGGRATEGALRDALAAPGSGPVHVATHGMLNAYNPMFSRIELARGNASAGASDDGRLEVHELLAMEVRSPLVFLSGCETGAFEAWLHAPVRGNSDLPLSQAFLSAGAATVVSTLWRIDDASAAELSRHFYRNLRDMSASEALARAQRTFVAEGRRASPYHWAAYVLSGDGLFTLSAQGAVAASVY